MWEGRERNLEDLLLANSLFWLFIYHFLGFLAVCMIIISFWGGGGEGGGGGGGIFSWGGKSQVSHPPL